VKAREKIKTLCELVKITRGLKAAGSRIVFTNGCFDILHAGHVRLLEKAKSRGEALIVGLNSDSSVRRLKGACRPIVPQAGRAEVVAALASVDYVVLFGEDTPLKTIKALKPDVLVKGADYGACEVVGAGYAGRVIRFPLVKGWSTTSLARKYSR
jgi:D-beta-D-heptose 7-phosphate kinase/D-beta-D-heptose 1-phosphate adenosyltransferase